MSVFVWSMVGIAIWHFTVFVPDRFAGGIVGAFLAAWLGGVASGFVIEGFALPSDNPPGMRHALYALPGSLLGLVASYVYGVQRIVMRPRAGSADSARAPRRASA